MDLSIRQMRMLREVARQGTISSAADQLGYTASAVSQQLSAIERSIGVAVLERAGRNVVLTDAGRELVVHADLVLEQMDEAQAAIERVRGHVAGTLKVGVIESVGSSMLIPTVERLRDQYPELEIRTRETDAVDSNRVVRGGELDLCFMVDSPSLPRPLEDGIERVPICRDWYRIVVPTGLFGVDPPAKMRVADLKDEPFVGPPNPDSDGHSVGLICRQSGFEANFVHQFTDFPSTLRMVGADMGVALLPDLGLVHVPDTVDVIEMSEPHYRSVELVFRSSSAQRPVIKAFVETVLAVAGEMGLDRGPAPS